VFKDNQMALRDSRKRGIAELEDTGEETLHSTNIQIKVHRQFRDSLQITQLSSRPKSNYHPNFQTVGLSLASPPPCSFQ
jgi:hypothetical protein